MYIGDVRKIAQKLGLLKDSDLRYVDYRRVKCFLEENGFNQESVEPSLQTGNINQGSHRWEHEDGREVTVTLKDVGGIPQISAVTFNDGSNRVIPAPNNEHTSVEDLAAFVNYGKIPNPSDSD